VNKRVALIAGIALLAVAPALTAGPAAYAGDGGAPVTCIGGSSCVIQLENSVTFFGNHGSGSNNPGVSIDPPPCYWVPLGDAHTGSVTIVANLADSMEYGGPLTGILLQIYNQAYAMQNENPMPPGEWYMSLSTSATYDNLCDQVPFEFVKPAKGGVVNPPPVPLPPRTLAQLAVAVMRLPRVGKVLTSPANGTTYSNMPTFVRVTMRGKYETSGGMPYLMVSASLDGQGATAWAYATPLALSSSASDATVWGSCGYLGSAMLASDPGAVAKVGAGGSADCGFTFRTPGAATITAGIGWDTCWVANAITGGYQAPPADCVPVPGADLAGLQWQAGLNIEEIQAGNG
jgi:hypothetical protein